MTDRGSGSPERDVMGTPGGPALGEAPERTDIARLWLDVLRTVADRGAHELRCSLNGVGLNVEVVRARSERGDLAGGSILPFARAAAEQVEALADRTEALLWLVRRPPGSLDVRVAARHVVALLAPAMRAEGGGLDMLDVSGQDSTVTSAPPEAVRLVVTSVLLASCESTSRMICRIVVRDAIILEVEGAEGAMTIAPEVARIADEAGIGIELAAHATTVAFPASP